MFGYVWVGGICGEVTVRNKKKLCCFVGQWLGFLDLPGNQASLSARVRVGGRAVGPCSYLHHRVKEKRRTRWTILLLLTSNNTYLATRRLISPPSIVIEHDDNTAALGDLKDTQLNDGARLTPEPAGGHR
jgi:hypothetical protein